MVKQVKSRLWVVRMARAHLRLWGSVALGILAYLALPADWSVVTRLLIAWDAAVLTYLITTAVMMAQSPATEIRGHAAIQDEGAFAIMLLTVTAALASLGAIFAELAAQGDEPTFWPYALAIGTVILSWAFTHTVFALRYAHKFYGEGDHARGLKFPDDDKPDYWDFTYFSFVIGMTFQVSDVAITKKGIRRLVICHGVLSFFFTTTIVALAVNIAASAI
jgi:uncharacterized membrane protein